MAKRVLHDRFFKQAKDEGYAARSAYKLKEIQQRFRIISPGDRVLDLGCAPGSWLQVASELVGRTGVVVGIDLLPVRAPVGPNVTSMVGDITATDPTRLTEAAGGLFDVAISDMAPNTSGAPGGADHFRSVRLCEAVLDLLPRVLKPGGCLAMKVFEGEALPGLAERTQGLFDQFKHFKPRATRDVSREIYLVAAGYRAPKEAQR